MDDDEEAEKDSEETLTTDKSYDVVPRYLEFITAKDLLQPQAKFVSDETRYKAAAITPDTVPVFKGKFMSKIRAMITHLCDYSMRLSSERITNALAKTFFTVKLRA